MRAIFKSASRALFRWYLSKFPLRDGKAYFYDKLHPYLMPDERLLTVTLDKGFRMRLDLEDAEQRKVYFFGHYHERYEAALVASLLDPGEVFWDVGANVGYFSLVAAAAVGETGEVVAFEPGAAALERLMENVSLNPFNNIRIFNLAVSDAAGEATLYRADGIADSSASLFAAAAGAAGGEVCRTVTLDGWLKQEGLRSPDFLKLDVEGAELAALQGALDILTESRPLLLVEMEEKNLVAAGASKAAIQSFLRPLGYQAAFLRKGRWHPIDDVNLTRGRNLFWFNPSIPKHREKVGRVLDLGTLNQKGAGERG
ncbi:MAG: FkbM family methyltransferase [Deltaproteobacteria bacterium]|nr:FkbM family methyltransferase [Deltaproteobacteria bacterium]